MKIKSRAYQTWLVIYGLLIGNYILTRHPSPVSKDISMYHTAEFALENSKWSLILYLLTIFVFATYLSAKKENSQIELEYSKKPYLAFVVFNIVVVLTLRISNSIQFLIVLFISFILLVCLDKSQLKLNFNKIQETKLIKIAGYALFIYQIYLKILKPFTEINVYNSLSFVAASSSHYAATILPADSLGTMYRTNYGPLMNFVFYLAEQASTILVREDLTQIFAMKFMQVFCIILLMICIFQISKKNFFWLTGLALSLSSSLSLSNIDFPNQTGARYFAFFLALNFLLMAKNYRVTPRSIFLNSLICSIFFVGSPEIGLVTTAVYIYIVLFSSTLNGIKYKTNLLIAVLLLISLYSIIIERVLSEFFYPEGYDSPSYVQLFSSGYGGMLNKWIFEAVIFLLFAITILKEDFRKIKLRTEIENLTPGIVSLMCVGWLFYYFNRQDSWNLWPIYILCLLGLTSKLLEEKDVKQFVIKQAIPLALIWTQIVASIVHDQHSFSSVKIDAEKMPKNGIVVASGYFQNSASRELKSHFDHLRTNYEGSNTLVLSIFPNEIRRMGFNQNLPWYDPFSEVPLERDLQKIIEWIKKSDYQFVLIENKQSIFFDSSPTRVAHYYAIIDRVGEYSEKSNSHGWTIYELR